jgi:tetratricopeptide (TPR) repeat protein
MNSKTLAGLAVAIALTLVVWRLMRPTESPRTRDDSRIASSDKTNLPRRPAPHLARTDSSTNEVAEDLRPTNILERVKSGNLPKLTLEQVQGYLRDNHRNADSLIGAFDCTQDRSLLDEAKQKFPNDPHVAFVAATQFDDSPEEHRKWIDTFRQLAPNNATADYLSAADRFTAGQTDQALADVRAALNKPIENFHLEFLQNNQEAYRAAGYSEVDTRVIPSEDLEVMCRETVKYKEVGVDLVDLAKSYQQTGDTASAQAALQLAIALSQRVYDSGQDSYVQQMVANGLQLRALSAMDPNSAYGEGNQTVQSRIDALRQQRADFKSLIEQWNAYSPRMSDQDVINFYDRQWRFGAIPAYEWAAKKYGTPAAAYP